MGKDEIKQANQKALPKFLLIMAISMLIGGLLGFCAAKYGLNTLAGSVKNAGAFFGTYIASWMMLATAVILPAVCIPIYKSAKKLISSWDGENEEISDAIDKKLSMPSGLQVQPLFFPSSSLQRHIPAALQCSTAAKTLLRFRSVSQPFSEL